MPARVTPSQAWRSAYRSWRIEIGHAPSDLPPDPLDPSAPSTSSRRVKGRSKAPVAAGGFVVDDDEEEEEEDDGGTTPGLAASSDEPQPYLPLSKISDALSLLSGAYEDDETLLAIFRDVSMPAPRDFDAVGPGQGEGEGAAARRGGAARLKVVQWDDWVKVVEALQGPEDDESGLDQGMDYEQEGAAAAAAEEEEEEEQEERPKTRRLRRRPASSAGGFVADGVDSEQDRSEGEEFSLEEEDEDEDEEEDDEDDYGARSSARRKGSQKSTPLKAGRASGGRKSSSTTRSSKRKKGSTEDEDQDEAPRELSEDQLETLDEIWAMFEERLSSLGERLGPEGRMERRHLEGILRSLNEKMGDKEIEEMLSEGSKLYVPLEGSNDLRRRRGGEESVGKEQFAGILLKARII